jgi:O-antigen biosynthesis protein
MSTLMIVSEKTFEVSFKAVYLQRLRKAQPSKVAVLVSSEYEGIYKNGGIGTYYRRLAEQLNAEGWYVILLLTWTEKGFGGESELAAVKHIFSTFETEQVLNLQPVHLRMLSARAQDVYDRTSICCFFFVQAILHCFPASLVYAEFPEMMGSAYRTVQAGQSGFLGHNCITAVTMHSSHEWVYEANEKCEENDPSRLWRVADYERFSLENADLSFFPSHFLRDKVESYGWNTARAIHMPNLMPLLDTTGSGRSDLPKLDEAKVAVVFFGRLEERKGLCTFVEALHALPPTLRRTLHVLFLGKIVPLYSTPLAHLDSRQYIEREMPTDVSYSILSDLYSAEALHYVHEQRCPVVCLTSPQENFPNTALEMGQLPVKLVVSDTGGFRETLELVKRSAGLYWFEPKNPQALAHTIHRAIADDGAAPAVPRPVDIERVNRSLLERKMTLIEQAFTRANIAHVERPRVTVGVFWQNQPSLLDCLASIEAQSYANLDVIVLDNEGDDPRGHETLEHARSLFPHYRYVRSPASFSSGAAWNHVLELAEGSYFLGLDPETFLAPFAVAHLVKAASHAQASIVCCPLRSRSTGEEIAGFSGGPLPRFIESPLRQGTCFLGAVSFLRQFRRLEDYDALTYGWEILAAALATGERITYYPYPLYESSTDSESTILNEATHLKQQYQLRQYVAQIPPSQWSKRQLSLLLMATQQLLQVQVQSPPLSSPPSTQLQEFQTQLQQTCADLNWARSRITAMESSKFWKLRHHWFRVKRKLHLPGWETE